MVTGRTGHDISPDVETAVLHVDAAADALKAALAALSHVWNRPGITLKERRIMNAAGKRARRSAI
jgi:hypothetical protein